MRIDDNSIDLIITFLESGEEKALNTFINLSKYPDEDRNEDFSRLIREIKELPILDVKSIQALLKPKRNHSNTIEYTDNKPTGIKTEDIEPRQNDSDPIEDILVKITTASYLDNSEKNILSSFYDNNLMDNYTRSLSKKMYFHILRTAQLKFHLFNF